MSDEAIEAAARKRYQDLIDTLPESQDVPDWDGRREGDRLRSVEQMRLNVQAWLDESEVYRKCDHSGQPKKMLGRLPLCEACRPTLGYLPLRVVDDE